MLLYICRNCAQITGLFSCCCECVSCEKESKLVVCVSVRWLSAADTGERARWSNASCSCALFSVGENRLVSKAHYCGGTPGLICCVPILAECLSMAPFIPIVESHDQKKHYTTQTGAKWINQPPVDGQVIQGTERGRKKKNEGTQSLYRHCDAGFCVYEIKLSLYCLFNHYSLSCECV